MQKLLFAILTLCTATALLRAQPNTLTADELADGWILLWDGETDYGWEWHGDAVWTMKDGVLRADQGGPGWLGTTTMFADYEFKAEFRTAADGNSGIFLRSARRGEPHRTGYELQIYDTQPQGFTTGSLVFYAKAEPAKLIPNEWNQYEVRLVGSHFVVKLNGKVVLDTHNPTHQVGVIGLQYNEGKKIEFRNLKLKPLSLDPLFNGKDLTGWKKVDSRRAGAVHEWSVRDGVIHAEQGPGQLETEKDFANLVLQLAIRTKPPSPDHHPNSGVFFRGDPGGFWTGYESQIFNGFHHGDRSLPRDFGTGGIYFHHAARRVVPSDGEYFYKTVVAHGRHISVWINGTQVSNFDDTRPEGPNARKQARLAGGVISLQAHDPTTNLDFKDIRAVELPAR